MRYIQKPWCIPDVEWRDGSELSMTSSLELLRPLSNTVDSSSLISIRRQIRRLTARKADTRCFDELLRGGEVEVSQLKHIYCEI